ncbi:MAG: hypothetical protein IKS01_03540 [Paludibacteraceae bacterium]|nr:hypothetical protein [Paludibacteraceae bacterium]
MADIVGTCCVKWVRNELFNANTVASDCSVIIRLASNGGVAVTERATIPGKPSIDESAPTFNQNHSPKVHL